jgi:hypothetical protein
MGDVMSIAPSAGSQVMTGSTLVVTIQRNPDRTTTEHHQTQEPAMPSTVKFRIPG